MSRRGTSLVEMLIVLVVLGIITSIAAPRLRPSPHGQVEQNTRLLAQDLDLARTQAYASRALVRVVVGDTIWQSFLDHNRDTTIAENATEPRRGVPGGSSIGFWKRVSKLQLRFGGL